MPNPYDRLLTKQARLNPVQKAIGVAARNVSRCPDCFITAELTQGFRHAWIEYSIGLNIKPCPVHQNEFADAVRPPVPPKKTKSNA